MLAENVVICLGCLLCLVCVCVQYLILNLFSLDVGVGRLTALTLYETVCLLCFLYCSLCLFLCFYLPSRCYSTGGVKQDQYKYSELFTLKEQPIHFFGGGLRGWVNGGRGGVEVLQSLKVKLCHRNRMNFQLPTQRSSIFINCFYARYCSHFKFCNSKKLTQIAWKWIILCGENYIRPSFFHLYAWIIDIKSQRISYLCICLKTKQHCKNLDQRERVKEMELEYLKSVNDISILWACQK